MLLLGLGDKRVVRKENRTAVSEQPNFQIDFEIADTLAKSERFGIVKPNDGQYIALSISAAHLHPDTQWNGLFNFLTASLTVSVVTFSNKTWGVCRIW